MASGFDYFIAQRSFTDESASFLNFHTMITAAAAFCKSAVPENQAVPTTPAKRGYSLARLCPSPSFLSLSLSLHSHRLVFICPGTHKSRATPSPLGNREPCTTCNCNSSVYRFSSITVARAHPRCPAELLAERPDASASSATFHRFP